jgi:hypothetical protein
MINVGVIAASQVAEVKPPVAGYRLWLDAADPAVFVYSTGNYIEQWIDKSAYAYEFTQAGAADRPYVDAAIQNGLPVVRFEYGGNGRNLSNSTGANLAWHQTAVTIFAVTDVNGGSTVSVLSRNSSNSPQVGTGASSTYWGIAKIGTQTSSSNLTPTGSNADVVTWKSSTGFEGSTSVTIYKNGTAASGAVTLSSPSSGDLTRIGAPNAFGTNGYLCEMLVYYSALNDTDREAVEGYLKTKWGTP